jgi:8-oxo-dGTP pyrophosphatase MutT (NUDIX family)
MQFKGNFLDLLRFPECYLRTHLPGHITGSAWIVNQSRDKVLLVHHATLDKWLQPGGHADGDENVLRVAEREAFEETGLRTLKLLSKELFDIDVHPIPAKDDFPEHHHYDLRFVFEANDANAISASEESHDVTWVVLSELIRQTDANISIMRMAEKTRMLL